MAFGKKYYSSYKSGNNIDYYCEVWLKDYSGSASEITLGSGGPIISYETEQDDRFSPILSSTCTLPFVVTDLSTQAFIASLRTTYQEKEVYLHLYKATSSTYSSTKPLWSGFLTMDLGSGEDVSFPYEQQLTFVDGLALLKEVDWADFSNPDFEDRLPGNYASENMYWGPATYIYWIKEILNKTGCAITTQGASLDYGFTTAINWYNEDMPTITQSSDPLHLTKCLMSMFHTKDENEVFTPDKTYTVLKEVLRHWGARITYWKHEFWIVQIPEYIADESGFIDNPDNVNSRQYSRTGAYLGSQDHLGDTYSTRYEQTISSNQISKLVGTKYNYSPAIGRVDANFLSLNGVNHYGGFPWGINAENFEIFQGRILNPSSADYLWVSIPLNWKWDMTGSTLTTGHVAGWWLRIKFNLYCTQEVGGVITTYYLQYQSSDNSYYWVDSVNWTPLGNPSPNYTIKSRNLIETNYIGFQEQIEFVDDSGSPISLTGEWDFYLDIEDYGTSSSNPGSFYCNFSGYNGAPKMRNPDSQVTLPGSIPSGTVSWSNSLQDTTIANSALPGTTLPSGLFPSGYNTGSLNLDVTYTWKSPLKGFLQVLGNTVNTPYGFASITLDNNSTNTEIFGFGNLVWGDCLVETARGVLLVSDGSTYEKSNESGKWGRGILTGEKNFTQMLVDEFLSGQTKVIISPSMRLVVGVENKTQSGTASGGGTAERPRYVNPIGRLREQRANETDPEYFFRRGAFHTLYDEWDYEGYEIIRETLSVTTTTNDIGGLGGSQDDNPIDAAKVIPNINHALMLNSPVASLRTTVPATGSNVAVNGNFNVASGWTLGTGWSINTTTKKASFTATGSTSELTQSVLTQELTYQINFSVVVTAGSLLVKAGSSGTTETITASGDYSIYLDCEGSNLIKFQAGTTFTGTITHITARDQKSLSSLPINSIGSAVFKTNDTLNLINSNDGEIIPLTVTSNQGASDTTVSVTAVPLYDDIGTDSILLINQDDLSAQYQNKTKGTVGGFDITATSIDSGSVAISSYIDDDSFGTASTTSLATSESIKAYVDTQVGSADTLQEVTDNGNTSTNSVMIGSSDAPLSTLHLKEGNVISSAYNNASLIIEGFSKSVFQMASYHTGFCQIAFGDQNDGFDGGILYSNASRYMSFEAANAEKMRLNSTGLGIGTTSPASILHLKDSVSPPELRFEDASGVTQTAKIIYDQAGQNSLVLSTQYQSSSDENLIQFAPADSVAMTIRGGTGSNNGNVGIGTTSPTEKLHVVGDILATGDSHADAFKPAVTGNPIKFKNFDSSTEFARITDGGNVLIGTTTDDGSSKLQVAGTVKIINGSGNVAFSSSSSGDLTVTSGDDIRLDAGGNDIVLRSSGTEFGRFTRNSGLQITSSETNANINLIPNGTGNVGIGLTNASAELEVIGDIRATDSSSRSITLNTGGSNQVIETTGGLNLSAGDGTVRATMYGVNTELKIDDTLQATKIILKSSGTSYFNGGNVLIGTTTDSGVYKLDIYGKARVQSVLELDDVLTLNAIATPSDPASGKSSIWMATNGDIKVKMNVGGTVVEKTLASYEE